MGEEQGEEEQGEEEQGEEEDDLLTTSRRPRKRLIRYNDASDSSTD
jgi:hypothetical protein